MNIPEKLSHYTTLNGFRSILESGTIRATNVMYLNDSREYFHAFDLFGKVLRRIGKSSDLDNEDGRYFLSECKRCIDGLDSSGAEQHFAFSLSSNLDQLGQWRAYGPIGIVFDTELLRKGLFQRYPMVGKLDSCKYDEHALEEELFAQLSTLYAKYNAEKFTRGKECIFDLIVDLQIHLYEKAAFYKHESFIEESEFRVTCFYSNLSDIKFRTTEMFLAPYIEVPFDRHSINSIIIGPCIDPNRTESSVRLFLDQIFPEKPPNVLKSSSPFRNW